jgi:hypothetical protein
MVEFALVVTVFMLLVLGTFDLARAYLAYTVVTNAAREASRYGAAHVGEDCWDTNAMQAGANLAVGVESAPKLRVVAAGLPSWVGAIPAPSGSCPAAAVPAVCAPAVPPAALASMPYVVACGTYAFHSVTPGVGALLGPITIRVDTMALAG